MVMWEITVRHDGLNKYRHIRGNDKYVVEQKAAAQRAIWNEMWQRKLEKEQKINDKQTKTESSIEQTEEATEAIKKIENILRHTLDINDTINWESLKDKSNFPKSKPQPTKRRQPPLRFWSSLSTAFCQPANRLKNRLSKRSLYRISLQSMASGNYPTATTRFTRW